MYPVEGELVRVHVVGDKFTGKSSMAVFLVSGDFPEHPPAVLKPSTVDVRGGFKSAKVELTDSHEQLSPSAPKPDAILLFFDVSRPETLESIKKKWVPEMKHYAHHALLVLVGAKTDLRDDIKVVASLTEKGLHPVTTQEGEDAAKEIKAIEYYEISSLQNDGVGEMFESLVGAVMGKRHPPHYENAGPSNDYKFWCTIM